eukprot:5590300-Pleurochrysis_carterae.AAC.1
MCVCACVRLPWDQRDAKHACAISQRCSRARIAASVSHAHRVRACCWRRTESCVAMAVEGERLSGWA